MSQPKLLRILDAVATRLTTIAPAGGFYTDIGARVRRDRREPTLGELPCVVVYSGERLAAETKNRRARCELAITVIAYADGYPDAEAIGVELLADIQRAIETTDNTLGGLLSSERGGLAFASDEIFLPEIGASAVGARVTYTAPHVRNAGDPEIS